VIKGTCARATVSAGRKVRHLLHLAARGDGVEGGEYHRPRLLVRPLPVVTVHGRTAERKWRGRRRDGRHDGKRVGLVQSPALLLCGLLHEAARDAVGVLGEPGDEGHELVGTPLRGLQAPAHARQLLPDGRLLLPQPLHLLCQRLSVVLLLVPLMVVMMCVADARRAATCGGAGGAALLAAHDAWQQVRLPAQERLVRELPPVRVHLPEALHTRESVIQIRSCR
jgi:hypothetical protein